MPAVEPGTDPERLSPQRELKGYAVTPLRDLESEGIQLVAPASCPVVGSNEVGLCHGASRGQPFVRSRGVSHVEQPTAHGRACRTLRASWNRQTRAFGIAADHSRLDCAAQG